MTPSPIHPACALCRGACCEGMLFPVTSKTDTAIWFSYHGEVDGEGHVYLPCPCKHKKDGVCSIYGTRPQLCRDFKVGGADCHRAIRRNRPAVAGEIIALTLVPLP